VRAGISAARNHEIDHIELFGQSDLPAADSKNFMLGPGKACDRSACGTGTSAKRACLDGEVKIREGQISKQKSIVGSVFEGSTTASGGRVYPSIKGTDFVNSEAELLLDPQDPFCKGIRG
jgi:4-hydroxyproline epimerase